jgi:hypothetical protein
VLSRLSGRRESSIFFLHQRQNNEQRYVPPPKQTITPTPLEVEAAPPLEPIIPVAATPSVTELHHVANSGGSAAQASRAWALVVGPQTLYTPCIFSAIQPNIKGPHEQKLGTRPHSSVSDLRPPSLALHAQAQEGTVPPPTVLATAVACRVGSLLRRSRLPPVLGSNAPAAASGGRHVGRLSSQQVLPPPSAPLVAS